MEQMKLAQHQVQEVPGVDLSSCNSFFAQAVVTVTAGTSSLPSSAKTVSIVVAFRGTASVTLLSECLSRDCSRPSLSLFSPALMLCSEVKNMLTDVRISLQPLAEESKTGPFGLCEGPSECFDLEPKVPGSLWFCSAFFKSSSSSSPSSTVLLVCCGYCCECRSSEVYTRLTRLTPSESFNHCFIVSACFRLCPHLEVLDLCNVPSEARTNPFSPASGAAVQWLHLYLFKLHDFRFCVKVKGLRLGCRANLHEICLPQSGTARNSFEWEQPRCLCKVEEGTQEKWQQDLPKLIPNRDLSETNIKIFQECKKP